MVVSSQYKMEYFNTNNEVNHITEKEVKVILNKYFKKDTFIVESFNAFNASDKMLGFLADYWKLTVNLIVNDDERKVLFFFIKAVSRSNAAKATMLTELNLFAKEIFFYTNIKKTIDVSGLKPWSPNLVAVLNDAVVFEDVNAQNFILRDKFQRFDKNHTEQALQAVARFHASTIIYEECKSKLLKMQYKINDEYKQNLDRGGYTETCTWFIQCMNGALEGFKAFSKHANDKKVIDLVKSKWKGIFTEALVGELSPNIRHVICHRDLWNNNIMFHYDDEGKADDCLMVDYQAVTCQPPTADVMLLLYCNLDPKYREENMDYFLDYYYQELKDILQTNDIILEDVIPKNIFLDSAEEHRKWGLVLTACLMPQFWVDEDLTTKIFTDSAQFDEILSKNKGDFIKKMMTENNDYKDKLLEIFDEIFERYCL